jgi:hypothetical protein
MIIETPGLYSVSEMAYHADPAPEPSLSRGCICDLLYASPQHAWTRHPRLNPHWVAENDRKFDLGSAAHDALLCGMERVVPLDYKDFRTKAARAARQEAIDAGKLPVLIEQYDATKAMVEVARAYWESSIHLAGIGFGDGATELSAFWKESELWCRARFDWLAHNRTLIVDYKSTLGSANPEVWAHQHLAQDGLDIQAAWYLRAAARTAPEAIAGSDFLFLVQECSEPYACSLVALDRAFLEMAEEKVEAGLRLWRQCRERDKWPGYTSRVHWVGPPSWQMQRWEEMKMAEEFA